MNVLSDAIELQRQALALRFEGHPDRAEFCGRLANSLRMHYSRTGDDRLLHEFFTLTSEAQTIGPVHTVWRYLSGLSWMYLQQTSSFYSVKKSIQCLSDSFHQESPKAV
jgi:hypothetical protein